MEVKYTNEQLKEEVIKNTEQAENLLNNKDRMELFLERLERKLRKVPKLGKKLSNVPVMVSLVRSYVRKDYQDIPFGSIVAIVSALIYFVSPIDLLPDNIPVLGYVDDAAVIAFVWSMVEDDVEEYKKWQLKAGKRLLGE